MTSRSRTSSGVGDDLRVTVPGRLQRRVRRAVGAFSKKVENHAAAVALYFMY